MRRRIGYIVASVTALLSGATWSSCSNDDAASPAKDGGADSGGSGGQGGAGFGGATGGAAGQGGEGNDGGSSGTWGASPTWEPIPGTAVGCTFERMTNAASVRFFQWEACSWTDGCEQAVFNENVFGASATFVRSSVVVDDGTTVRAGLTMWSPKNMAIVASDDGMGLDAIRVTGGKFDCRVAATSVWKQRFAVHVQDLWTSEALRRASSATIGAMATPPVVFTIPEAAARRAARSSPSSATTAGSGGGHPPTASAPSPPTDGSDFPDLRQGLLQGPVVEYTGITTTGPLFLMEEFLLDDGGGIHAQERTQTAFRQRRRTWRRRTRTTTTGQPAFANSHVGFMRGIGRKGLNLYDSVELWATLYSTNPTNLIPELIAPLSFTSMPVMLGGWGDLATVDTAPPEGGMAVGIGPLVASR